MTTDGLRLPVIPRVAGDYALYCMPRKTQMRAAECVVRQAAVALVGPPCDDCRQGRRVRQAVGEASAAMLEAVGLRWANDGALPAKVVPAADVKEAPPEEPAPVETKVPEPVSAFVSAKEDTTPPKEQSTRPPRVWERVLAWCREHPSPDGEYSIKEIASALFPGRAAHSAEAHVYLEVKDHSQDRKVGRGAAAWEQKAVFHQPVKQRFRLRELGEPPEPAPKTEVPVEEKPVVPEVQPAESGPAIDQVRETVAPEINQPQQVEVEKGPETIGVSVTAEQRERLQRGADENALSLEDFLRWAAFRELRGEHVDERLTPTGRYLMDIATAALQHWDSFDQDDDEEWNTTFDRLHRACTRFRDSLGPAAHFETRKRKVG
jgi:hypothetical protein